MLASLPSKSVGRGIVRINEMCWPSASRQTIFLTDIGTKRLINDIDIIGKAALTWLIVLVPFVFVVLPILLAYR